MKRLGIQSNDTVTEEKAGVKWETRLEKELCDLMLSERISDERTLNLVNS